MKRDDYLWKGILEDVFDDFLRFMHPDADEIFDFGKGITFLDKELEQLFPPESDESSLKIVDKLAKVYTREGSEEWVLIHCEVQGAYRDDFPRRMFTYFYRILDKYNKRVAAYAILTEKSMKERPDRYGMQFLDTGLSYRYKVYKIARQDDEALRRSNNPFALVALTAKSVLGQKSTGHVREWDSALVEIKLKLAREFLNKPVPKEKIRVIMDFLRYHVRFENGENNQLFEQELAQLTERSYTMGIEELIIDRATKEGLRAGIQKGIQDGIRKGIREGREAEKKTMIIAMLRNGMDEEWIANISGTSVDYVRTAVRES
jgi:predicted transposase YdaD